MSTGSWNAALRAVGAGRRAVDLEQEKLLAALRKHGRNRTLAALELGIHRSTLWRRMRRLGLTEEGLGPRSDDVRSGPTTEMGDD